VAGVGPESYENKNRIHFDSIMNFSASGGAVG
jgi:hypothetical protein